MVNFYSVCVDLTTDVCYWTHLVLLSDWAGKVNGRHTASVIIMSARQQPQEKNRQKNRLHNYILQERTSPYQMSGSQTRNAQRADIKHYMDYWTAYISEYMQLDRGCCHTDYVLWKKHPTQFTTVCKCIRTRKKLSQSRAILLDHKPTNCLLICTVFWSKAQVLPKFSLHIRNLRSGKYVHQRLTIMTESKKYLYLAVSFNKKVLALLLHG